MSVERGAVVRLFCVRFVRVRLLSTALRLAELVVVLELVALVFGRVAFVDLLLAVGRTASVLRVLVFELVFARTLELFVAEPLFLTVRVAVAVGLRSIELRLATRAGFAALREFLSMFGLYIDTDLEFTEALPGRRLSLTLYTRTLLLVTRAKSRRAGPL